MNLNEPVYQDSSGGISEMPGQVSVRKGVSGLSSLQVENTEQEACSK